LFILQQIITFKPETLKSLSKPQKTLDSSLVSNENLSKILWHSGWALGKVIWAKMDQKWLYLWRHSQKSSTPTTKFSFFFFYNEIIS